MLRKALIASGFLLAVFLLYASTRPETFEVKREVVVNATAAEVYAHVNDFRQWAGWSPWEKLDPNMQREFGGKPVGIGSTYSWSGNEQVGKGRMEIVGATIPYSILIQLDFSEPFPSRNQAQFTFEPADNGGTQVTWTMSGKHGKLAKLMSVFFDMDAMVGPDFEKGLAALKAVSEQPASTGAVAAP